MKKLLLLLVILLSGCKEKEPYIIGFSGTLTGTKATIGIQEMYGAELAVNCINDSGGINGRMLQLEIRDDLNDPLEAIKVDDELIDMGAIMIIGHSFSSIAVDTVNNANEKDFLLISPSIGTDTLTGVDDNFIRLVPTATYEAEQVANIILSQGADKAIILYDLQNIALTEYHLNSFVKTIEESGNESFSYGYNTGNSDDYNDILDIIEENDIKDVFVVGSSLDAGNIIQLADNSGLHVNYHLSAWASSGDFSHRVGIDLDKITLYNFYNNTDLGSDYKFTSDKFKNNYGTDMTMVASYAYDIVTIVADVLLNIDEVTAENLKNEILNTSTFEGVQSSFKIDQYGDVLRDIYQFSIVDGVVVLKDN